MVTHIGTVFSYNYDHIILKTHTLTVVFKTHKAQKPFQLELYKGNKDITLNYCYFIFCLPPIPWIRTYGRVLLRG
jgi:hypothetical protein